MPSQACASASSGSIAIARRSISTPLRTRSVERQERALERVRAAERGPCHRVFLIVLNRFFECGDRTLDRIARRQAQVHHAASVALVGLDRPRLLLLDVGDLRAAQRDVQALAQLEDDLVLQREDVADAAVDFDRALDFAGAHVDEIRRDANELAETLEAADDDPRRAQPAADIDGERLVEVRARGEVAQRIEDARAADERQAMNVLQIRADGLGDAGADPVIGRLARDVGKRHHGHRALDRGRRRRRSRGDTARRATRQRVELGRDVAQILVHVARGLIAERRRLLERPGDDGVECRRHATRSATAAAESRAGCDR